MEMELDVRYYIDVVLRHWKAVLVVFLVATLVAAVVSFIREPTYEATATLVEQTYEFFDMPRLASLDRTVVKFYPALARTDAIENEVIETLEATLSPDEKTPGTLLSMVTVREDRENPALFRIRAQADAPDKAVLIANTWAEQYVEAVGFFEAGWASQLEVVEQDLEAAEAALTEFREQTGLGLVEDPGGDQAFSVFGARGVELHQKSLLLAEHRQARDNVLLLLETAELARDAGEGANELPLQLLATPVISNRGQLTRQSVLEQEDMTAVIQLLETEEAVISDVIDQLTLEVRQLQGELADDQLEFERLTRARDLAEAAYAALTNEIQENQLFQIRTDIVSGATHAKLVGPDRRLNVALGAALGLAGGVLAAFVVEYIQTAREKS